MAISTAVKRLIDSEGLGYQSWLELEPHASALSEIFSVDGRIAHCNSPICAGPLHEKHLPGVSVGDTICGVRWWKNIGRRLPINRCVI